MNNLLLFFALPFAVIILSIVLYKIIKSVILVTGAILSICLVITFAIGDVNFLIPTIIYTILSFCISYAVNLICKMKNIVREKFCKQVDSEKNECECTKKNSEFREKCNNKKEKLLTITSECVDGCTKDLLEINSNVSETENLEIPEREERINATINVMPNSRNTECNRRNSFCCRKCRR